MVSKEGVQQGIGEEKEDREDGEGGAEQERWCVLEKASQEEPGWQGEVVTKDGRTIGTEVERGSFGVEVGGLAVFGGWSVGWANTLWWLYVSSNIRNQR